MTQFIPFNNLDHHSLATDLQRQLELTAQLIQQLEQTTSSSWHTISAPLQAQLYALNHHWGIVGHLQSVNDSPELRQLHEHFLPLITDLYVNLGQNKYLYHHWQAISQQPALSLEQQKVIANELRDFKLSGVALGGEQQQTFKQLQQQLSELSSKFEHNVLDATDSYTKIVSREELSGVPEDIVARYHASASADNQAGYKISLQMPSYLPLMQFCANRDLRHELYRAYVTRASELGTAAKFDNSAIIRQILELRQQKAALLEFNNYAELSLVNKMATTPQEVLDFLYQLAEKSRSYAEHDLAELNSYAEQRDGISHVEAWDLPYYSEQLQQHKYSYSSHELKQYFTLPKVFQGLFTLVKQLYNLDFIPNPAIPTWHPTVSCYDVILKQQLIGHIYFDLSARVGKQAGAWMNSAQDRHITAEQQLLPIAYVVCNFSNATAELPSSLSFDDVQTLFHEMGHALHHLLTTVNNYAIAGINGVEWDAVELPSQFMENFAWDYKVLTQISGHIVTGEVLPRELFAKVLASRHYQSGLHMLRQLELAIFDLLLHSECHDGDYAVLLAQLRQKIAVVTPPEYSRATNSFSHIFAGGYAAGYYSYKWAEVLACDVFSCFDGLSGVALTQLGEKFRQTVLSQGGVRPMLENFKAFMGREPQIAALLRYSGMNLAAAEA